MPQTTSHPNTTLGKQRRSMSPAPYQRVESLSLEQPRTEPRNMLPALGRPPLRDYHTVQESDYTKSNDGSKSETFLRKLWGYILEQERQQDPVMYWSRTRRYLLIPDEERLVQEVAVVLFKQKDYSSFARQLNIYNFRRCSQSQIREMKSAEGIPDKCKVWVHPMLHGDSPFSDLSKIKRHASNKKSNRFPAPPMFPDTQPRHLARDAISYPLEAYLPSRYRHPSSEVDDRTPSPHPRYSYSSRSESEGPSFEAAPVSRPTSRPQLKLVTALNDHDLSASRGGLQHHRSSSVPNSLPAAITSAPDEVMRSPVEVDHSDRRERALSAFPLSSRVIASAQLDEAACGNISSTAFPIFQLEQPVFDGADSCEDRKDLRKGSLNDLMQVVFR